MSSSGIISITVLMLFISISFSQERTMSFPNLQNDSLSKQRVWFGFERLINTYHWNALGLYENTFGKMGINIREELRSTLIHSEHSPSKNEQSFFSSFSYHLSENIRPKVQTASFILSDNQSLGVSNVSSYTFYGGAEIHPIKELIVEPLIGYRFENQKNNKDKGVSYKFSALSPGLDIGGYFPSLNIQLQRDNVFPRTLENHRIEVELLKVFEGNTKNDVSILFTRNRREFYLPLTENLDKRIEKTFSASDVLDYEFNDQTLFTFQGNILNRTINKSTNTSVKEFKLETSGLLTYTQDDSFASSFRILYAEREEQHFQQLGSNSIEQNGILLSTESLQDNFSERTMITGTLHIPLSKSDMVYTQASASILRYDTPSKDNVEDRDELWYGFNVITTHYISPLLRLKTITDATSTHLVYLFSERSANNSWNRTLRLSPIVEFHPSEKFSTTNTYEVLANYTVYDFEDIFGTSAKSFSFRQFSWYDSTTYQFASRLQLVLFSQYKLFTRGELKWKTFTEFPINTFEEQTFIPQIRFIPNMHSHSTFFSFGLRYFKRFQFSGKEGKNRLEQMLYNLGPIASIYWGAIDRLFFSFQGWYEYRIRPVTIDRSDTNLSVNVQWLF